MSNLANVLTIEGSSVHEGINTFEKRLFHADYELLDSSLPFAALTREMAHAEEVVVISGTIKVSP